MNDDIDRDTPADQPMDAWLDDLKAAARFLTRVPVGEAGGAFDLNRALRAFPVIGALIGLAAAVVLWLAVALNLPAGLAAAVTILGLVALTGGLHEDGLADTADGFWGGATREAKLAIMHDSRIGTFGVVALAGSLLLRSEALATLTLADIGAATGALVAAAVLSRHSMVALLRGADPARHDGVAATVGRPSSDTVRTSFIATLIIAVPCLWLAGGIAGIVIGLGLAALVHWGVKSLAVRQVGGHTGDVCGALQQATETAVLLGLAAAAYG